LRDILFSSNFAASVKSPAKKIRSQNPVTRFLTDETAATSVEYCVVLLLILMVVISAVAAVGSQTSGLWNGIQSHLRNAGFIQ
jgi:Flp pilus assembly pilin Flp